MDGAVSSSATKRSDISAASLCWFKNSNVHGRKSTETYEAVLTHGETENNRRPQHDGAGLEINNLRADSEPSSCLNDSSDITHVPQDYWDMLFDMAWDAASSNYAFHRQEAKPQSAGQMGP